jgi:hypothetical protein
MRRHPLDHTVGLRGEDSNPTGNLKLAADPQSCPISKSDDRHSANPVLVGWILPDLPAKDLVELPQRQMTDERIVARR